MAIPNYTYLKLKTSDPKGVITVEGSFEQVYYCLQDCVTQATILVIPYDPNGYGHDTRRAPAEEAAKEATALDRSSIDEADKVTGGNGGLAGPSIQRSAPQKGLILLR